MFADRLVGHFVGRLALLMTVSMAIGGMPAAHADNSPVTPALPPVIGPLQAGPPAYPPDAGIALLPAGRAGVTASADVISPTPSNAVVANSARGIAGVSASADALSPVPGPG